MRVMPKLHDLAAIVPESNQKIIANMMDRTS